jgi:multidrug efflux pump subunit AcrA (membrane-fusion protein)
MEIVAQVGERERSMLKVGQAADVRLDALPGAAFQGTVKAIGGMATGRGFWEGQASGFDITIQLPVFDARARAGFTAQVVIPGEQRKNVLSVPRQALFSKDGKRVAYVKTSGGFEATEIRVQNETESRAILEGLKPGDEVALIDPTAPVKSATTTPGGPGIGGSVR